MVRNALLGNQSNITKPITDSHHDTNVGRAGSGMQWNIWPLQACEGMGCQVCKLAVASAYKAITRVNVMRRLSHDRHNLLRDDFFIFYINTFFEGVSD